MTKENFNHMLVRIYAAFGRTAPAENNAISVMLYERVKFIGDEYCEKIAETLEGYEKLPANVGLVIISVYNGLAPARETVKKECAHCHNNSGFFWLVNEKYAAPRGYSVRCPYCNGGDLNELNRQFSQGSKKVTDEKIAAEVWEELFGNFADKVAKDKEKAAENTGENTGTDGNRKVAGHFKPIAQTVDKLNDVLEDFWNEA